jgi:hypothetical protein
MPVEEIKTAQYGLGVYGVSKYGVPYFIDTNATYGIAIFGRSVYGLILDLPEGPVFSDSRNCLFSLEARKKTAKSGPGFVGIYQTMPTSKGRITKRLKLYSPFNPRTEAQQANRQKITNAVLAWQNLTDEQKNLYNERAIGKPFTGYNIFIKEHLLSN